MHMCYALTYSVSHYIIISNDHIITAVHALVWIYLIKAYRHATHTSISLSVKRSHLPLLNLKPEDTPLSFSRCMLFT